jgi:hypothetical protein
LAHNADGAPQAVAALKKSVDFKFSLCFHRSMHARPATLIQSAIRHLDGLPSRALNLLGLASLLSLLILSRGAGTG